MRTEGMRMQRLIKRDKMVGDNETVRKRGAVNTRNLPANETPHAAADNEHLRWYAVRTQPHRELRAKSQLENQAYEVFLPQCLKTVRHARKLTSLAAPFFPQYLFLRLDLTQDRWRSVNGTFGVASLVMRGEVPHPVPRGVVEAMIASVDAKGFLCLQESLATGARVRLTAGPFAEQLGVLERLDESGRVRVLLDIMGGTIPVELKRKFVTAA